MFVCFYAGFYANLYICFRTEVAQVQRALAPELVEARRTGRLQRRTYRSEVTLTDVLLWKAVCLLRFLSVHLGLLT